MDFEEYAEDFLEDKVENLVRDHLLKNYPKSFVDSFLSAKRGTILSDFIKDQQASKLAKSNFEKLEDIEIYNSLGGTDVELPIESNDINKFSKSDFNLLVNACEGVQKPF